MNFSYDDAAYYVDRAASLLAVGDVMGAVEAVAAVATALEAAPLRGLARDAHAYAVAAATAMREQPRDAERALTYLQLCGRTVEEMAAYERAALFERVA
ncbi:hypothetical protein [Halorarius litoreus]|uniref:hypothetical protein n=1 Tax=Halorarius litoreus TaxID=2962676 RepID=UPI0020CD948D|nr:hypothetical protein [Halorarius litoreus]